MDTVVVGGITAFICFLFGRLDLPFQMLIFFLVADFVCGFLCAAKNKNINSRKMWDGFIKKILTLLAVAVAVQIDKMMGLAGVVRLVAMYGFIGSELISIVENLKCAGVPIPDKLMKFFSIFSSFLDKSCDTTKLDPPK